MERISIIGSGLVGALMALYLARRGYEVEMFDSLLDPRESKPDKGRSINLAMSCRGLTGLAGVGLTEAARKIMVPMRARAIHNQQGEINYQPFGRNEAEHINAVSRTHLNNLLLDTAETYPNISFHFNEKLIALDIRRKRLYFELPDGERIVRPYTRLIGADGATSVVRETLARDSIITSNRTFLDHGYKELSISSESARSLAHEHLHLWPRDTFLLLGNPNLDYSITGSLFLPKKGKNSFEELSNELQIGSFFEQAFPDAYAAMPALIDEFTQHPMGNMSTIQCSTWNYLDQCLLIGDAAHGLVPFFGQGMNCGFEDCRILDELLTEYDDNWQKVMPAFYARRKPNTDAVAHMSLSNFHEIQSKIRDPQFLLKKQLEQDLMHRYPDTYISKHVMVMFTNTPYNVAQTIGIVQGELLTEILYGKRSLHEINWNDVTILMTEYDKKLASLHL